MAWTADGLALLARIDRALSFIPFLQAQENARRAIQPATRTRRTTRTSRATNLPPGITQLSFWYPDQAHDQDQAI